MIRSLSLRSRWATASADPVALLLRRLAAEVDLAPVAPLERVDLVARADREPPEREPVEREEVERELADRPLPERAVLLLRVLEEPVALRLAREPPVLRRLEPPLELEPEPPLLA